MNIIKEHIFPSHDLSNNHIETILSESSGSNIDLSDIYMQYSTVESWTCEDGIVKNGSQHIDSGYGIRAISNETTGFSYGNNFDYSEIIKAAKLSKSIVESKETKSINLKHQNDFKRLYVSESPITSLTDKEKVTFLREIDNYIKKKDKHDFNPHRSATTSSIQDEPFSCSASLSRVARRPKSPILNWNASPSLATNMFSSFMS